MKLLSKCIADFYVKRNIICEDEKDVYGYGLELILNDVFVFTLILIISALFWNVKYGVEFLITICVTRIFFGGFHAKKAYICKMAMVITFVCVMSASVILKNISFTSLVLVLFGSFIVALPFVPVKHPNKNITKDQRNRNKLFGVISYLIFSLLACLSWKYIDNSDGIIIALSLCAVTVLVIIGSLFNWREVKI